MPVSPDTDFAASKPGARANETPYHSAFPPITVFLPPDNQMNPPAQITLSLEESHVMLREK
jgi:hypothetical protein